VVADGMGGHRAGATASQAAVAAIGEVFSEFVESPPEEMLRSAIQAANQHVHGMATEDPELRGMGTTAVALLLGQDGFGWVAHVGDSRAYRLRGDRFEALTHDHSVVAELERRGLLTPDEAAVHPRRNEILRSVGIRAEVEVETSEIEVEPGDLFLLCSDGLSGMLSEIEIAEIAEQNPPEEAARILVGRANEAGGRTTSPSRSRTSISPSSRLRGLRPARWSCPS
jgi:serine/threonine protein phosphatase PrpC